MTKPIQAQIEAALAIFEDHYWDSIQYDKAMIMDHVKATLPLALTAAAEVGEQDDTFDHGYKYAMAEAKDMVAATIERCAQVVDNVDNTDGSGMIYRKDAIAAIRALKDQA